jgi:hypothetical protein
MTIEFKSNKHSPWTRSKDSDQKTIEQISSEDLLLYTSSWKETSQLFSCVPRKLINVPYGAILGK